MGGCVGSHHDSSGSLNENSDGTGGNLRGLVEPTKDYVSVEECFACVLAVFARFSDCFLQSFLHVVLLFVPPPPLFHHRRRRLHLPVKQPESGTDATATSPRTAAPGGGISRSRLPHGAGVHVRLAPRRLPLCSLTEAKRLRR